LFFPFLSGFHKRYLRKLGAKGSESVNEKFFVLFFVAQLYQALQLQYRMNAGQSAESHLPNAAV
jgi:hypothetical protein